MASSFSFSLISFPLFFLFWVGKGLYLSNLFLVTWGMMSSQRHRLITFVFPETIDGEKASFSLFCLLHPSCTLWRLLFLGSLRMFGRKKPHFWLISFNLFLDMHGSSYTIFFGFCLILFFPLFSPIALTG